MISARTVYTAADLQQVEDECVAHARELGLDPPEILFHLVPAETVYSVACRQVPGRYSHSDFGVAYERMKAAYDRGEGRIYEVIFNAEPAHAYLLEGNSFIAQTLVIAHCLGHGDMFRHNPYFGPTDKDFPPRVRSAAGRIDRYYARYGRRAVEDFITACQAFAPHASLDRLGRSYTPREPEFEPLPYDELFPEEEARRRAEVDQAREQRRRRFPTEPQRDILAFVAEHGHGLEDWQRDVISIVRAEHAYFAPQARTKILNEAVAVWAHQHILQALELDSDAFVDAQALNAQVACPHAGQLNPYNLGIELLREIEAIARGELDELDDADRERFAFRDAGRRLGGARDSQVLLETLHALTDRYPEAPPERFARFRRTLVGQHGAAQRRLHEGTAVAEVLGELRRARARVGEWRLERQDLDALAPGFKRIYRRGRRAYRTARQEPSTENLHELRKRAKYLWYAAQIVRGAAPKKMKGIARRAHELSNLIGEEHDLALLAQRTDERRDRFPDATAADELTAMVERRRDELQREALELARRLFRNKPRKVARALGKPGAAT